MKKNMWMVRAGRSAAYVEDFEIKRIVAIGWEQIKKNLTKAKSKNDIISIVEQAYPGETKRWKSSAAGQITRFCFEIKTGDLVITYNSDKREYLVGTVISDLKYQENIIPNCYHYRETQWIGSVKRDNLSTATKNSLGSISTLFFISIEARNEITNMLSGKPPNIDEEENSQTMDELRLNTIESSKEFIKDKVLKLDWEEMQELVAGIIRAMGYKTRVSPKGSDRGKDIFASPDGLGLELPRIYVEVKHKYSSKISAPEIRSFIGGRKGGASCLYVSTSGFTKDALYEAERSDKPLTLLTADDLVDLLIRYYENLDNDTKALVPLIKVYWPV